MYIYTINNIALTFIFTFNSLFNFSKWKHVTGSLKPSENINRLVYKLNFLYCQGYMRKGHALQGMKRYEEAMMAFLEGLDIEPNNQAIKQGIDECKAHLSGKKWGNVISIGIY